MTSHSTIRKVRAAVRPRSCVLDAPSALDFLALRAKKFLILGVAAEFRLKNRRFSVAPRYRQVTVLTGWLPC